MRIFSILLFCASLDDDDAKLARYFAHIGLSDTTVNWIIENGGFNNIQSYYNLGKINRVGIENMSCNFF